MEKLNSFLPRLYLPLLALLCFSFVWQPLRGVDDFWAHAAIGRWMGEHGRVPDQTLFLWAPGTPIPWVYHSWLSQFVFWKLLDSGGVLLGTTYALLMTYIIAMVTVVWLWLLWARRARVTSLVPFLFTIALWCSSPRLHPRPELFSGFFILVLLTFLLLWTERRARGEALPRQWPLHFIGLALMFALWANFHGGVATGLVFIALTLIGECLQDYKEKRPFRPSLLLAALGVLCALAINLNPYGISYWSALRPVGGVMFAHINEWKPLWKTPLLAPEAYFVTGFLGLLALNAWLQNPNRRFAHLLWLLFAAVSYVTARRQIWTFAQVCLIVMAANAIALDTQRFWNTWKPGPAITAIPLRLQTAARLSVVLVLIAFIPGAASMEFSPFTSLSPRLPMRGAEFLKQNYPQARLLSHYATSSYLNWHFAGNPPLFIDLVNAYPDRLIVDYFDMEDATPRGIQLFEELKISHIFLRPPLPGDKPTKIAQYLEKSPAWTNIYDAPDATIFMKKSLAKSRGTLSP